MRCRLSLACLALLLYLAPTAVWGGRDHRLDIKRYGSLREVERWQLDRGEEQYKARRWEAASNEYEKFLKLYQESDACSFVQYRIAQCLENKRKVNQAIKEYIAVLDYFPDSPEAPYATVSIARCHAKCGEKKKQLETLQKLVQQYPDHIEAAEALWFLSAYYLDEGENVSLGVRQRHQIIDKFPKHDRFRPAIDWLFNYYALTEEAPARALEVRYKIHSKAQSEIDLGNAYGWHARHWHHQKKPETREKFLKLCLEVFEGFGKKFPQGNVAYCERQAAYFLRETGHTQEALDRYLKYFAKHPNDDGGRVDFARWLENLRKWDDARLEYRKMANEASGNWEVAYSYHRQGKGKEAVEAYEVVVQTDYGRTSSAYYQIGQVYQHTLRDYEKAIVAYIDSNHSMPENLFRVVECYSALKKYDRALQQCKEILFIGQRAPKALQYMVIYVYERRNGEKDRSLAINTCKRILDQFKKSGESSWAHQHLEDKYKLHYTGGGVAEEK